MKVLCQFMAFYLWTDVHCGCIVHITIKLAVNNFGTGLFIQHKKGNGS